MSTRLRDARGQAAVELVVVLPLVCVVLAVAWQAVLAADTLWSAAAAARAAARAQAVGAEPLLAARRVLPASLDDRVEIEERDDGVAVHVAVPAIVPGLELGTLTARSTFASQR